MDLTEQFQSAVDRSRSIPQKPANDELLRLYALFKQASEGDNEGERPGGFDFKGAAKHDAWMELKGKDGESCMNEYIQLVDDLHSKYA